MRQAPSFTSAFFRHFVRTCTARPTAANPGQSCSPTDLRVEATSNGLRLIRQAALGMDSNTSQAMAPTVITAALWNSNAQPTAESPGRLQSIYLTIPQSELSTWILTATSSSGEKDLP